MFCHNQQSVFLSYEYAVRSARYDLGPEVIDAYIHLGLKKAQACQTAKETKMVHFRLLNVLEECICDDLLTTDWRYHCHKYLRRLLPLLYEIVEEHEYRQYIARLNTIIHYFLPERAPTVKSAKAPQHLKRQKK